MTKTEVTQSNHPVLFFEPPYWHDSGDIFLQVHDRGIEYKFRVHQFILSLHSFVWRDMFVLGARSKQRLELEDLPVVPLQDPVEDVCLLLSAFYYGM